MRLKKSSSAELNSSTAGRCHCSRGVSSDAEASQDGHDQLMNTSPTMLAPHTRSGKRQWREICRATMWPECRARSGLIAYSRLEHDDSSMVTCSAAVILTFIYASLTDLRFILFILLPGFLLDNYVPLVQGVFTPTTL